MKSERLLASSDTTFNSEFTDWASGSLTNPDNVTYFCKNWFVTAPRGPQADFILQPLNREAGSGLRVLVREPPEMVRVWHRLPAGLLESGKKFAKFRVRGEPTRSHPLQLDSVAVFRGSDVDRKFVRSFFGPMALEQFWREAAVELEGEIEKIEGARFITFRFSGVGVIEFDFCRFEEAAATFEEEEAKGGRWAAARGLATRVMTKLRGVERPSSPIGVVDPSAANDDRIVPSKAARDPVAPTMRSPTSSQPSPQAAPPVSAGMTNGSAKSATVPGTAAGAVPSKSPQGVSTHNAGLSNDGGRPAPNVAVASGRRTTSASSGAGVLQNSDFEQWSGNRPEHWKVEGAKGVAFSRAPKAPGKPFSNDGVIFSWKGIVPGRSVSISQSFVGLGPKQSVDVVVVGWADARTEVDVVLRQSGSGAGSGETRTRVTLRPRWQFRTVRLQTPSSWRKGSNQLSLIISEEQPRSVHLALLAAGLPGQDIAAGFEVRELSGIASNAVVNGTFEHWTGPLVRPLSARQVEITEEWTAVSKTPSSAVEARLTEIAPRGLRDGRDYAAVLGLGVHGELAGPYVRLQAALDVLQIVAGPPRQLSFFARTALPSNGTEPMRRHSVIHEVFIAERHRVAPESDEFNVKRLFTVKRNLRVRKVGERHSVDLGPDQRAELAAKASEMLHDPTRSLLLVFECSGSADIAIGDVRLGNDPSADKAQSTLSQVVALEDPNIAAQVTLLKGLDHWRSQHALRAPTYQPARPYSEEVKWVWPASSVTTDVVVCVHNAIDETLDCLDSLRRCTTIPHTVTIVDDKSSQLTREQLRRYIDGKPWMRLIENEHNLGYTRSANIGLSSSSAEWVVLLNSDTIVTSGWLEGMFEAVKSRPGVAMVGPVSNAASWQSVPELHDVKGGWCANPLPDGWSVLQMAQVIEELSLKMFPEATLLNGFCTLMRRDVIEEVGFLDEAAFPMGYGEENDLCLRVRKAGYSLAIADHVYVYHVKSASFGTSRRSELSKRGTAQLHAKHPDVDMKQVQRELAELTALIELRKRLRKRLDPAGEHDPDAKVLRRLPIGAAGLPAMRSPSKDAAVETRMPR